MMDMESAMTLSICKFRTIKGACRAAITTIESPSMVKFFSFIDAAKEAASRAASASPKVGSHVGLI